EREELGLGCNFIGSESGSGEFYHGPDQVLHLYPVAFDNLVADLYGVCPQHLEFGYCRDEGDHDLRHDGKPFILDQFAGSLHDRLNLHVVNLRIGQAESAAAMSEHRVEFMEEFDLVPELLGRDSQAFCKGFDILLLLGEELVQWRVEEPDGYGQSLHLPEDAEEIPFLHRQDLGKSLQSSFQVFRQDHFAYGSDPVRIEEHMFGTAEADAFGAEFTGDPGIVRGVGIRTDLHRPDAVNPAHQGAEIARHLRGDGRHFAEDHFAGRAVQGYDIPFLDHLTVARRKLLSGVVDLYVAAAGNAAFSHAAGNNGGVRGHAAAGGKYSLCGMHPVDVFRACFHSHQNDLHAGLGRCLGFIGSEDDGSGGCSR